MIAYLARRLGLAVIVIVLVMVMLAVLVNLVPGDPSKIILGPHATPDHYGKAPHPAWPHGGRGPRAVSAVAEAAPPRG